MKKQIKSQNLINTKLTKQAVIEALTGGNTVFKAVKLAGVGRSVYYGWLEKDEQFKREVEWTLKKRIRVVEDCLYTSCLKGNITAIIFFLCNRDKANWQNVQRIEGSGLPSNNTFQILHVTPEDKQKVVETIKTEKQIK